MAHDWMEQASCSSIGPEFLEAFPSQRKPICAACPASADCEEYGLADPAVPGRNAASYAGLTAAELARRAKAGVPA